jgi:ACS family tartrate transporter-like MFS transporter
VFVWLCLFGFFAVFWASPFWVLPTLTLSASAAAVSIGFINMCANLSGWLGPWIVGKVKEAGLQDSTWLRMAACCYLAGGMVVSLLRVRRGSTDPAADKGGARQP